MGKLFEDRGRRKSKGNNKNNKVYNEKNIPFNTGFTVLDSCLLLPRYTPNVSTLRMEINSNTRWKNSRVKSKKTQKTSAPVLIFMSNQICDIKNVFRFSSSLYTLFLLQKQMPELIKETSIDGHVFHRSSGWISKTRDGRKRYWKILWKLRQNVWNWT